MIHIYIQMNQYNDNMSNASSHPSRLPITTVAGQYFQQTARDVLALADGKGFNTVLLFGVLQLWDTYEKLRYFGGVDFENTGDDFEFTA